MHYPLHNNEVCNWLLLLIRNRCVWEYLLTTKVPNSIIFLMIHSFFFFLRLFSKISKPCHSIPNPGLDCLYCDMTWSGFPTLRSLKEAVRPCSCFSLKASDFMPFGSTYCPPLLILFTPSPPCFPSHWKCLFPTLPCSLLQLCQFSWKISIYLNNPLSSLGLLICHEQLFSVV